MASDDAYHNALAKKARLIKELEEVNSFLKMYQKFAPKGATVTPTEGSASALDHHSVVDNGTQYPIHRGVPLPGKRESTPERFAPIIHGLIRGAGRPIPRGELVNRLSDNGTPVPGKDKSKNLGTIMWRLQDRFVNLAGHGYWIKGEPFPLANYPEAPLGRDIFE